MPTIAFELDISRELLEAWLTERVGSPGLPIDVRNYVGTAIVTYLVGNGVAEDVATRVVGVERTNKYWFTISLVGEAGELNPVAAALSRIVNRD